ncbi:hypothetical protein D9M71_357600 [compost metagenome]
MDRHLREQFKDHPQFKQTIEFCARYDAAAFDPEGETLPLAFFEPMLRRVFAKPRQSLYMKVVEDAKASVGKANGATEPVR